jgi:hypothetical protein
VNGGWNIAFDQRATPPVVLPPAAGWSWPRTHTRSVNCWTLASAAAAPSALECTTQLLV